MRRAVYAGSFNPPTNGHVWMIEQGRNLFDKLIVAVALNPRKKSAPVFSLQERVEMLKELTKAYSNVSVHHFDKEYLVNYAQSVGAQYILRGIRTDEDYEYERRMRHANSKLNNNIETVFLMPPIEFEDVSSSFIMDELIGPNNWEEAVKQYVPEQIYKRILEKKVHLGIK